MTSIILVYFYLGFVFKLSKFFFFFILMQIKGHTFPGAVVSSQDLHTSTLN